MLSLKNFLIHLLNFQNCSKYPNIMNLKTCYFYSKCWSPCYIRLITYIPSDLQKKKLWIYFKKIIFIIYHQITFDNNQCFYNYLTIITFLLLSLHIYNFIRIFPPPFTPLLSLLINLITWSLSFLPPHKTKFFK